MRLTLAVLCLALAAGLSSATGYGRGYTGLLILIAWFLALSMSPARALRAWWSALLWVSVGCTIMAIAQLPWLDRVRGPFGSPNYLGAFAAVCVFIAWRSRHRIAMGANLAAVALSQSRGALLALGAGGAILLWRRSRWLSGVSLIAATAAVLVLSRPEARMNVWALGLQVVSQRPLTGWGIGGVQIWPLDHFYSVPLDWLVATGVIGLGIGVWLAVEAWLAAGKIQRQESETVDGDKFSHRAILAAWIVAGLFLSAAWPMWLVLFALLGELVSRDVDHRAGIIDHHQPLLDGGVRALRSE